MSVTVSDLLKLPSLRQATVIGGHRGLSRIVSSISVLESTDPDVLVENVFPAGEFYGSEIVITGFLNCLDDIDCQCANIQRLAEGGEVGLILFCLLYTSRLASGGGFHLGEHPQNRCRSGTPVVRGELRGSHPPPGLPVIA